MKHDPQDYERTTMPEALPRPEKRVAGRTPTSKTPVTVRGHHVAIEAHHREYVRERLGQKLGKFAPAIERIYVMLEDLNGPKGGVDHECRIQVTLSGLGQVVVKERDPDAIAAFDLAADRMEITLRHHFGRVREGHVAEARRTEERYRERLPTLVEEPRWRP
ncbi:HPF/RaiA family ribosome-associated protein [Sandaracinus amylolyticus]|uniref:Ribosomal subunit interface protein n=1 Tax=Sandaracinus amylolyticus TaxID=927083 RepID=A0A0F6SEG0_9BACT|nr:HPF/RaiA family ribosome-associated protein [Sandaracinus amylolyticus]AKF05129.1 Ribosomal subunit interface protein [Sandaracinus amylolyticus]